MLKEIPTTDRISKMFDFIKNQNIEIAYNHNKGNKAVAQWDEKTSKKLIKAYILTDPSAVYRTPVSNEELAYLYSLSHEFGHIHDLRIRKLSYEQQLAERSDKRHDCILQENRAWYYARRLLTFLYKDDRMVLSEFDKHYQHFLADYLRAAEYESIYTKK